MKIKSFENSLRPEDPKVREQVDIGYAYDGEVVIFHQIRPVWQRPWKIMRLEFAKNRYYKSKQIWKLYWMRANGKWELYAPLQQSTFLDKLLEEIQEDKLGCFFG